MMRVWMLWVYSARLAMLKVLNLIDCTIEEWMVEHGLLDMYMYFSVARCETVSLQEHDWSTYLPLFLERCLRHNNAFCLTSLADVIGEAKNAALRHVGFATGVKARTYNRRVSQMVTHSRTSRPVQSFASEK